MRKQGRIFRWDPVKGFGFIRSPDTDQDIFFHVRDYRGATAPGDGEPVWFEEIHVGGKGPRAMSVTPTHRAAASRGAISLESNLDKGVKLHRQTARPSTATSRHKSAAPQIAHPLPVLLLALVWVAVIAWGVTQRRLPAWTVAGAIALNLVTFFFYAHDKNAAQQRRWRVSENTLHLLGLLGGWPFAWVAQQMLRHKSRKAAFRMTYWVTVTAHFAGLLAVIFLPQFRLTIG